MTGTYALAFNYMNSQKSNTDINANQRYRSLNVKLKWQVGHFIVLHLLG